MDIPLCDPKRSADEHTIESILETLKSGRYIMGERVKEFERLFSEFTGTMHSVGVSSGTAALHTALLACGVGKGDEVITTTHSFVATANAIVHSGARPVLVDIEEESMNIDPEKIQEKITDRTKAIVPVHLYGHPADMDPIKEMADKHDLKIVEDACQAHGAEYKGSRVGSIGDAGCFSFFPSKIMTVFGDGGMITTSSDGIASRSAMFINHGREASEKYRHDVIGLNYRMSELSATAGIEQLKMLNSWNEKRRGVASIYNKLLKGVEGVKTPEEKGGVKAVYYVYTIRVGEGERDRMFDFLRKEGIGSGIYYPTPIHLQPAYKGFGFGGFPVSERVAGQIISLPMHPYLKEEEIVSVVEKVRGFFR